MTAMRIITQIFLITVLGLIAHELAHFLAAKLLGYEAIINLNSVKTIDLDNSLHE